MVTGFTIAGAFLLLLGFFGTAVNGSSGSPARELELKLLGAFFLISPWIGIGMLELKFSRARELRNEILSSGIPRKAVIREYRETGTWINNAPKMRLLLDIHEEDKPGRLLEVTVVVPLMQAAAMIPDMEVSIHESDRGIVIHWPLGDV